jgi:hypothetical protein
MRNKKAKDLFLPHKLYYDKTMLIQRQPFTFSLSIIRKFLTNFYLGICILLKTVTSHLLQS